MTHISQISILTPNVIIHLTVLLCQVWQRLFKLLDNMSFQVPNTSVIISLGFFFIEISTMLLSLLPITSSLMILSRNHSFTISIATTYSIYILENSTICCNFAFKLIVRLHVPKAISDSEFYSNTKSTIVDLFMYLRIHINLWQHTISWLLTYLQQDLQYKPSFCL